jgi:ankyrin repeat protein
MRLPRIFLSALVVCLPLAADVSDDFYNAIRRDDAAAVEQLLKAGGANAKDSRGNTPLMYAAAVGSEAMMKRLLEAGADVKAKNAFDATALVWCGSNLNRIKLLVERGADVNVRTKQGRTPIFVASAEAGGLPAVEYLISKGATLAGPPAADGLTPLAVASAADDTALVRYLVEKGGPAAVAPPGGPMALMNAAMNANVELVKLLLAKGVDVNSVSPPELERVKNGPIGIGLLTPLILSVAEGDTETVRVLLAAGANHNAQDVRGMTPIMLAVATDHPNRDIIKMLLEKKPDMKVKSKAGETALDWAMRFNDSSIIAAIRAASPGIEPVKRETPAPARANAASSLASVQKSLPLLQTSGKTMFTEGGCVSCHGGNIVTSAVAAARAKGVKVDETAASETLKATSLQFASRMEQFYERIDGPAVEILTFALAALADENVQSDRVIDAMVRDIAAQQLASGHWAWRGIVRPPSADHFFTNSAYSIRAFKRYAPPARCNGRAPTPRGSRSR